MERKMGLFSRRARSKAASPHGCQSTGLCACCSRYGLFSCDRRLVCSGRNPSIHRTSPVRAEPPTECLDQLAGNPYLADLNDGFDVRIVDHVTLQGSGMWHECVVESLCRLANKMTQRDVWRRLPRQ